MATWDTAFEAKPAQADVPSTLGSTGRATRNETRQRLDQEHVILNTASTGASVHRLGSARCYYQAADPTLRPDGVTSIGTSDSGRVWIDSDNDTISKIHTGSAWVIPSYLATDITASGTITGNLTGDVTGGVGQITDQAGGADLLVETVEIGVWNMDSDATKVISHTLPCVVSNIRHIEAIIFSDLATTYAYPLNSYSTILDTGAANGGIYRVGSTLISLYRLSAGGGGVFDGVAFDNAIMNRGYVMIWYVA